MDAPGPGASGGGPTAEAAAFGRLADAILEEYWAQYPQEAVGAGLHEYDGRLTDLAPGTLADRARRVREHLDALTGVDAAQLDEDTRLDKATLSLALRHELFQIEDLRLFRRNPLDYVALIDASQYIKRAYAPLPDRAAALARHFGQVPRVLEQAQRRLELPVPATFLSTALDMLAGVTDFLRRDLEEALQPLDDGHRALLDEVRAGRDAALDAVAGYAAYLEAQREAGKTTNAFAIGAEAFGRMLRTGEGVRADLDHLAALGREDLARNRRALEVVVRAIDLDKSPAEVMADAARNHATADAILDHTREVVDELHAWIGAQQVVTVPDGGRLLVEPTPRFMSWAFAWMSAPGAFEESNESYFYLTLPDPSWDPARQAEWLTKFSGGRLRTVSIHEAWPGHFVHHLWTRRLPGRVRRMFGVYSSWEAWAHYVEQMMIEAGFRPDDLELRLAQLAEALLRDVRYLAAIGMHSGTMTLDEATRMFETEAFLAPGPARAEAVRGTFDPGYLNYTLGKLMLLKLRDDYRDEVRAAGGSFSLRAFHDRFLSFGAPALPLVREAMLSQPGDPLPKWSRP